MTDKRFVNVDNGKQGGTHWTCFCSFGGSPDNVLLQQLPKPITFHIYKSQDIKSRICGTYCIYYLYLKGRMEHSDVVMIKK